MAQAMRIHVIETCLLGDSLQGRVDSVPRKRSSDFISKNESDLSTILIFEPACPVRSSG